MTDTTHQRRFVRCELWQGLEGYRPALSEAWTNIAAWYVDPPTVDRWWYLGISVDVNVDVGTVGEVRWVTSTGEVSASASFWRYVERTVIGFKYQTSNDPKIVWLQARRATALVEGGGVHVMAAEAMLMAFPPPFAPPVGWEQPGVIYPFDYDPAANPDPPPVVEETEFTLALPVANGAVVGTVPATDNIAVVSMAITGGNYANAFSISNTGVLTVASNASFIPDTAFVLTVTATDGLGRTGSNLVTVSLTSATSTGYPPSYGPGYSGGSTPSNPSTRTTGLPASTSGASSMHLYLDPTVAVEVSAELEVITVPTNPELVFWAMDTEFVDTTGTSMGGAHIGLQFAPGYPSNRAVNWGGYSAATGSDLTGTTSALPSALNNPNTRDFNWVAGRKYRLRVFSPSAGVWRGTITDLTTSTTTVIRDLNAPGSTRVRGAVLFTEAFSACEISGAVRWSNPQFVLPGGSTVNASSAFVNYETFDVGACTNTNQTAGVGGITQTTGVARTTTQGTTLTF